MPSKSERVTSFLQDFFTGAHVWSSNCSTPMTLGEFQRFGDTAECESCGARVIFERDVNGILRASCPNGCGVD